MSEEQKPPERPAPSQFQSPPLPNDQALRAAATERPDPRQIYMEQAQSYMKQIGINIDLAIKVLIIAAVSGVLAALLDRIVGLPVGGLAFTFGWIIAALNGATYAYYSGNHNLSGLIMAAVSGVVTLLLWYVVMEIIGRDPRDFKIDDYDSQVFAFSAWFDQLNVLKVILTGIIVGMLGFGWFALLRRLPEKFIP